MKYIKIGQTVWIEMIKNGSSKFTETTVKWKGNGRFKTHHLSHRSFHENGSVVFDKELITSTATWKVHFTNPQ